jgi:prepilin-type N-terminal cleavage/methylation domain-containing protein
MVLLSVPFCRPRLREFIRAVRGFSLLEIILVLFVLGLLAAALVPSAREMVERARREAEVRTLEDLAATITASFENTDLTNLNVAAMPGTIGAADVATGFSATTSGQYTTTGSTDWFAKVGRLRGLVPLVGVSPAVQPALVQITRNPLGNSRWLFAGPVESGRQRFLLVSLMAGSDQLALPAYEASGAWFEAIWSGEWDSRTAGVPAYWSGRLSAAQLSAWGPNSAGMTQSHKLCVRRISLPKFRVTVNNNHATESAFVSFNNTPNAFTAAANTGATQTGEILGGRLVVVNRGTSWPGTESLRFPIRENATVTLQ